MIAFAAKAFGALGLAIIIWGIFAKKQKKQEVLFAFGGVGLLLYSIYLKDPIFIPLQLSFVGASIYKRYTLSRKK